MNPSALLPEDEEVFLDPLADTPEILEDPIKRDFRNFLYLAWRFLRLPEPTPIQYDIATYLQHGPRRSMIEAFRGVGKSWITSAFVCWLLLRNPQLKILVVSASKERADNWTTFTLRVIREMPMLQHLVPRDGQRDSKISFDVGPALPDHAPSVKSVGVTGQLSGSRAHVIVPDDVEIPNNSATQLMRDKLSEAVKEFDAILKPGGRILYLGTPQTEESLYNKLLERGYEMRVWPARYPDRTEVEKIYGARIAPFIMEKWTPALVGQPTDPKRFNELDLIEREASYGRSGFRLQFMLDTRLSDADRYPLRVADLMIMPLDHHRGPVDLAWGGSTELILDELPTVAFSGDRFHKPIWIGTKDGQPEYLKYTGSVMFIDPSGRGKDETGYAVVKILHGRLFLTASGGYRDGYGDTTLKALSKIAIKQRVNKILVEPNFGDAMFIQVLKPVLLRECEAARKTDPECPTGITIEEAERAQTQKEARIIGTLEPVMNQHRLVVCKSVIEADYRSTEGLPPEEALRYQLFYQMTRVTKEKGALVRDDRLDALAGAVAYWQMQMARDSVKAVEDHQDKLMKKALEDFIGSTMGRTIKRQNPFTQGRGRWAGRRGEA